MCEERAKAQAAAAREGGKAKPIDAIKITEQRRVLSSSEALMRILGMDIATWWPAVTIVTVYPPGEEVLIAGANQSLERASDRYVAKLDRYFQRPVEFAHLNICDYFGQTNSAPWSQIDKDKVVPKHAKANLLKDSCAKNPHAVWRKLNDNDTLARLVSSGAPNTEGFWLRRLLLLPGMHPRSFAELCTADGVTYPNCTLAADAQGLMKNGTAARLSLDEEIGDFLSSGRIARGHLVALIHNLAESGDLLSLVRDYQETLSVAEDWAKDPDDVRVQRILQVCVHTPVLYGMLLPLDCLLFVTTLSSPFDPKIPSSTRSGFAGPRH